MDARKHLIIIKGKDQTDSVSSFQFHDGKCEVVYTSAPNKLYSFQRSNVEILPLQKKIDPARVIVTVNGQTISGIDEILDFSGYYRIVRNGKKDLSFRRGEVQFQQNCLADGKNQEAFQYFKETAAAISLVAENGINILSMQYDKIKQVSEDTVLASYLAPQKDVKMPQMPEAVIYPFGLNQSQKLAVERALSSKISIIQGPPGTGKTQTILNIIANVVRSGKTVAVVSNNNSATHNVVEKLEKKLTGLEKLQATMKSVNAYYRKHKTLEGCPGLSDEDIGRLQSSMANDWRKDPVPYPSFLLTNNNANIRRVRQRIDDLKNRSEFVGWTFPGGEAKINEAENRLQLLFDEKPPEDQRRALKSEGFKWAPSQGAWQRQLNQNAIRAAARLDFLRPEDGQSPYQLQSFARKTEKDMSR